MHYVRPSAITSALLAGGLRPISLVRLASASAPVRAAAVERLQIQCKPAQGSVLRARRS